MLDASLVVDNSLSGLGDRPMQLKESRTDKTLASFAIRNGSPVFFSNSVLTPSQVEIALKHWKQYCENQSRSNGSSFT